MVETTAEEQGSRPLSRGKLNREGPLLARSLKGTVRDRSTCPNFTYPKRIDHLESLWLFPFW